MFENEVEMQDTNAEYSEESYEDLFLDSEDEDTEDTNEETEYEEDDEDYEEEEEESEEETYEETTEEEETLDYKYLGKVTPLPQRELAVIAERLGAKPEDVIAQLQKGANYDESPTKKIIHRLAVANNLDDEAYMKFLGETATTLEERVFRDKIVEEHPDWDEEKIAMRIELDKRQATADAEYKAQQEAFEQHKPFIEFLNKYPDFDVQTGFPDEVAEDIEKGIHPIVAYESYIQKQEYESLMEEIKQTQAKEQKRADNRRRAVGSLKDNGGDEEKDPFLAGLMGR